MGSFLNYIMKHPELTIGDLVLVNHKNKDNLLAFVKDFVSHKHVLLVRATSLDENMYKPLTRACDLKSSKKSKLIKEKSVKMQHMIAPVSFLTRSGFRIQLTKNLGSYFPMEVRAKMQNCINKFKESSYGKRKIIQSNKSKMSDFERYKLMALTQKMKSLISKHKN